MTKLDLQFTISYPFPLAIAIPVCNATPSLQSSPIKGEEEMGI